MGSYCCCSVGASATTHQQDNNLPSIAALMQQYGVKRGSGFLREEISEPSFHCTVNDCWELKMGRDLLSHLAFAPLAQSSHDHLYHAGTFGTCFSCTSTPLLLTLDIHPELPTQAETKSGTDTSPQHFSGDRGRDWGSRYEILSLTQPQGPCMAWDTSWLASLHSA